MKWQDLVTVVEAEKKISFPDMGMHKLCNVHKKFRKRKFEVSQVKMAVGRPEKRG